MKKKIITILLILAALVGILGFKYYSYADVIMTFNGTEVSGTILNNISNVIWNGWNPDASQDWKARNYTFYNNELTIAIGETAVKVYCAAKDRPMVVDTYQTSETYEDGSVVKTNTHYAVTRVDIVNDKFMYEGKEQTYQGLGYILSSDASDPAKQEAIWRTAYNARNTQSGIAIEDGANDRVLKTGYEYTEDSMMAILEYLGQMVTNGDKKTILNSILGSNQVGNYSGIKGYLAGKLDDTTGVRSFYTDFYSDENKIINETQNNIDNDNLNISEQINKLKLTKINEVEDAIQEYKNSNKQERSDVNRNLIALSNKIKNIMNQITGQEDENKPLEYYLYNAFVKDLEYDIYHVVPGLAENTDYGSYIPQSIRTFESNRKKLESHYSSLASAANDGRDAFDAEVAKLEEMKSNLNEGDALYELADNVLTTAKTYQQTGTITTSINEELIKEIGRILGITGSDITMDDIYLKVSQLISNANASSSTPNADIDNLIKEARLYVSFYKMVTDKKDVIQNKSVVHYEDAKVMVDTSTNEYTVGPFSIDYLYYAVNGSEGYPLYWSGINEMKVMAGNTEIGKVSPDGLIRNSSNTVIGSIDIKRNADVNGAFDQNYQFPRGRIDDESVIGTATASEKFYITIDKNNVPGVDLNTLGFEANIHQLKECQGTLYRLMATKIYTTTKEIRDGEGRLIGTDESRRIEEELSHQALIAVSADAGAVKRENLDYPVSAKATRTTEPNTPEWDLDIIKVDEHGDGLTGAEFEVKIYRDGEENPFRTEYLSSSKGGKGTTDTISPIKETGTFKVEIKETKEPSGYVKDNTTKVFKVNVKEDKNDPTENGRITSVEVIQDSNNHVVEVDKSYYYDKEGKILNAHIDITIENEEDKDNPPPKRTPPGGGGPGGNGYSIDILKYDSITHERLTGAKFVIDLYKGHNITDFNKANAIDANNYAVSNENGKLTIRPARKSDMDGDLTLVIKEIEAPNGYNPISEPIVIEYKVNKSGNYYSIADNSISIKKGGNIVKQVDTSNVIAYHRDSSLVNSSSKYSMKIAIPNEEKNEISTTMQLGGYVFLDKEVGKGSNSNELYDEDEGVRYAKVILHSTDGTVEKTTISGQNGYYIFNELDPTKQYYVEFEYDGIKYEDIDNVAKSITDPQWAIKSKALEQGRDTLNNRFAVIGSYPNNYGTNGVYTSEDTNEILRIVNENIVEFMKNNPDKDYPTDDGVIYNNLDDYKDKDYPNVSPMNYVKDRKIKATTQGVCEPFAVTSNNKIVIDKGTYIDSDGKEKDIPEGKVIVYDKDTNKYTIDNANGYTSIYPKQLQINMGLQERPELDLEITTNRAVEAKVTVNGKTETYDFGKEAILGFNNADINSTDLEQELRTRLSDAYAEDNSSDVDIKIEYAIQISSNMAASSQVTELVDYVTKTSDGKDMYEFVKAQVRYYQDDKWKTATATQIPNRTNTKIADRTAFYIKLPDNLTAIHNMDNYWVYITLQLTDDGIKELQKLDSKSSGITTNSIVEINGYQTFGNNMGILDRDSIPGNLMVRDGNWLNKDEDDTREAKVFKFVYDNLRKITGNVKDYTNNSNISNIDVKLYEIKASDDEEMPDTKALAKVFSESDKKWHDATAETGSDGSYTFEGYLPGNYVIEFTYGNKTETIAYNGEDYQSVKAKENMLNTITNGNISRYWYQDINENDSVAYDDVNSRLAEIEYLNKYSYEKGNLVNNYVNNNSIQDELIMKAYTPILALEVENARTITTLKNTKEDSLYEINNINLGIQKRPKTDLRIEKTVKNIAVRNANGQYIIPEATPQNIGEQLVPYVKQTPDGAIFAEIDDQLLPGATLVVTYDIKVTNNGDSNSLTYYRNGDNIVAITYYGEDTPFRGNTGIVLHSKDGKTVQYVSADAKTEEVTTNANQVVDYMSSNYTFTENLTPENANWVIIKGNTENDVKGLREYVNGTVADNAVKAYTTILHTGEENPLRTALKAGETAETTITLTKALTTTEDLNFENLVEIVEVGNTAGRVDHAATPGNLDPVAKDTLTEHDADDAALITITDPTGEDRSNTFAIITAAVVAVFAAGIILIKKFALPKNTENK